MAAAGSATPEKYMPNLIQRTAIINRSVLGFRRSAR
jgi:hypothetical protein